MAEAARKAVPPGCGDPAPHQGRCFRAAPPCWHLRREGSQPPLTPGPAAPSGLRAAAGCPGLCEDQRARRGEWVGALLTPRLEVRARSQGLGGLGFCHAGGRVTCP